MRKIFRVYFKGSQSVEVDVEEQDVLEACDTALKFIQTRGYTYKFNNINKVELISEPITLLSLGDAKQ